MEILLLYGTTSAVLMLLKVQIYWLASLTSIPISLLGPTLAPPKQCNGYYKNTLLSYVTDACTHSLTHMHIQNNTMRPTGCVWGFMNFVKAQMFDITKNTSFWDVMMLCSPTYVNWCFAGTQHPHLQGWRHAEQAKSRKQAAVPGKISVNFYRPQSTTATKKIFFKIAIRISNHTSSMLYSPNENAHRVLTDSVCLAYPL